MSVLNSGVRVLRPERASLFSCATALLLILSACAVPGKTGAETHSATPGYTFSDITETSENDREIPARVFRPQADCSPCDLIIFSHGAYATYDRYDVLLTAWAEDGYVVVAPQHVDSEEHPDREAYASANSQPLRLEDYLELSELFAAEDFEFEGLTLSGKQIAAGHSYGGLIALLAGGAVAAEGPLTYTENAVEPIAVLAVSPPGALEGRIEAVGYSSIDKPTLVITGTTDVLPGFIDEWETHLDSYEASQPGLGYALIFEGMDHYFNGAFGRITPEGAASEFAIDTLNTQISAFLEAALNGEAPSGTAWTQTDNPIVRTLTK